MDRYSSDFKPGEGADALARRPAEMVRGLVGKVPGISRYEIGRGATGAAAPRQAFAMIGRDASEFLPREGGCSIAPSLATLAIGLVVFLMPDLAYAAEPAGAALPEGTSLLQAGLAAIAGGGALWGLVSWLGKSFQSDAQSTIDRQLLEMDHPDNFPFRDTQEGENGRIGDTLPGMPTISMPFLQGFPAGEERPTVPERSQWLPARMGLGALSVLETKLFDHHSAIFITAQSQFGDRFEIIASEVRPSGKGNQGQISYGNVVASAPDRVRLEIALENPAKPSETNIVFLQISRSDAEALGLRFKPDTEVLDVSRPLPRVFVRPMSK